MNGAAKFLSLTLAAVALVVAAAVFWPSATVIEDGPRLVGQMQNFTLAETVGERPDIAWTDTDGKTVKLADFDGKLVLLNFWATWCAPCIRELPSINALQAKMQGDDFTVIALSIDREGKPVAERMRQRLKLDRLPLYLDPPGLVAKALDVRFMPTTVLFDRRGREIGRMEGVAEWNGREASDLVRYFIDRPNHVEVSNREDNG